MKLLFGSFVILALLGGSLWTWSAFEFATFASGGTRSWNFALEPHRFIVGTNVLYELVENASTGETFAERSNGVAIDQGATSYRGPAWGSSIDFAEFEIGLSRYNAITGGAGGPSGWRSSWRLQMPYVILLYPLLWLAVVAALRRLAGKSIVEGICAACGYDLRATPDRCPECGLVPTTPRTIRRPWVAAFALVLALHVCGVWVLTLIDTTSRVLPISRVLVETPLPSDSGARVWVEQSALKFSWRFASVRSTPSRGLFGGDHGLLGGNQPTWADYGYGWSSSERVQFEGGLFGGGFATERNTLKEDTVDGYRLGVPIWCVFLALAFPAVWFIWRHRRRLPTHG